METEHYNQGGVGKRREEEKKSIFMFSFQFVSFLPLF